MKKAFFFSIVVGLFCISFKCKNEEKKIQQLKVAKTAYTADHKLESHVKEIVNLVNSSTKYNTEIGFFVDMSIPSSKNRFFIYNLKKNKIISKGLVSHGSGSETGIEGKLKFSNIKNSLSSSLGKYTVGYTYKGTFGKAYKLYGLDKTNSNAFNRNIVLHQYASIPFQEQEDPICNSHGCPMVNERFFSEIEKAIDTSKKKIILSIYY